MFKLENKRNQFSFKNLKVTERRPSRVPYRTELIPPGRVRHLKIMMALRTLNKRALQGFSRRHGQTVALKLEKSRSASSEYYALCAAWHSKWPGPPGPRPAPPYILV